MKQLSLFPENPPARPSDDDVRQQFIRSVEQNFSVIAPAGVGKTQSIVERIVALAQHPKAQEWLPRLVVVTFTKRAADEMQQRAREEILRAKVPLEILEQFNGAFFGTIHSFCVELLRNFGFHLGLPAKFELVENDDELWLDFLHQTVAFGGLTPENHERFRRHTRLQKLLRLGRASSIDLPCAEPIEFREPDFTDLLSHPIAGQGRVGIETGQELARNWHALWCGEERFLPLPKHDAGSASFKEVWKKTFAPFRAWLCDCALRVAADTAQQYRAYRVARALLNYDDQVALASDLLRHSIAARQIREREYRVLLDEAQDTDPAQFHILLECARPVDADHDWQTSRVQPPAPGRFCMVGDAQQSIYSSRADLARYQKIRALVGDKSAGREVIFTTTFRCDHAIIDFVNRTFPQVFDETGQVDFVPLQPRLNAGIGQVVRFQFALREFDPKDVDRKRAIVEATALAKWIVENGLKKLRARHWSEVAILVPQRRWFSPLQIALRQVGLQTQVQSPRDINGDSPAYAWLTALVLIAAQPRNGFEIFGVVREIFGISDDELAHFSAGKGYVFRIDRQSDATGAVSDALNLLWRARRDLLGRPLRDAVASLISATNLRSRLAALPREFFDESAHELDDLLALASLAEKDEQTLPDFAETLRQEFYSARETRPVEPNAVQLLTGHKAKGLQWDAVILPFFHRREYPTRFSYPKMIHRGSELPVLIAFDKDDISTEDAEQIETRERQERQRLLYVSLTRARHTLVLADDAHLFTRNVARPSSAAALKTIDFTRGPRRWETIPGPNHNFWRDLATELSPDPSMSAPTSQAIATPSVKIARLEEAQLARALERARQFPHRSLPSSFVADRSDEKWRLDREPEWREPAPTSGAIAYGRWWHELMQSLPWHDVTACSRIFAKALENSPDKLRSKREWESFQATELARKIFRGEFLVHSEMPLLWCKSASECVEGVIDLALLTPERGEWLIVDWKTDAVRADAADSLLEIYRAQVQAYVEAMRAITQQDASGLLYSSATGLWLTV